MNGQSKTTLMHGVEQLMVSDLVCVASYHTWASLLCDMRPHKQTWSDTSATHPCVFPIEYIAVYYRNNAAAIYCEHIHVTVSGKHFLSVKILPGNHWHHHYLMVNTSQPCFMHNCSPNRVKMLAVKKRWHIIQLKDLVRLWLLQNWMLKAPSCRIVASNFKCSKISLINATNLKMNSWQ